MPSKKKKYNARFPPARIKKIMQTDEEVGKVAAAVPVIISRALELFVESLVKKASEITQTRNAKTLTTSHLKACILADNQFHFLKDLVSCIPDVQGEDESSNPSILPQPGLTQLPPRQPKRRKNQNIDGNAGPSQSTAEESESGSGQEDEDSEEASSENTSDYLPPGSSTFQHSSVVPNFNRSSNLTPDIHSLRMQFPGLQNCNTNVSSAEEDYDS